MAFAFSLVEIREDLILPNLAANVGEIAQELAFSGELAYKRRVHFLPHLFKFHPTCPSACLSDQE
jgi:hypothetical protein